MQLFVVLPIAMQANNGLKSCQCYNEIMEMDRPPAYKYARVQDGKQRIYLEWPNLAKWCDAWQLKFNVTKCKVTHFGRATHSFGVYYLKWCLIGLS